MIRFLVEKLVLTIRSVSMKNKNRLHSFLLWIIDFGVLFISFHTKELLTASSFQLEKKFCWTNQIVQSHAKRQQKWHVTSKFTDIEVLMMKLCFDIFKQNCIYTSLKRPKLFQEWNIFLSECLKTQLDFYHFFYTHTDLWSIYSTVGLLSEIFCLVVGNQ